MKKLTELAKKRRQLENMRHKSYQEGYKTGLFRGIAEGRERQIKEFKQLFKIN